MNARAPVQSSTLVIGRGSFSSDGFFSGIPSSVTRNVWSQLKSKRKKSRDTRASWSVKSQTSEIVIKVLRFDLVLKSVINCCEHFHPAVPSSANRPVIRKAFPTTPSSSNNSNKEQSFSSAGASRSPSFSSVPTVIQGVSPTQGQTWQQLDGYSGCKISCCSPVLGFCCHLLLACRRAAHSYNLLRI